MRPFLIATTTIAILAGSALGATATAPLGESTGLNPTDTHEYLLKFHRSPKETMNTPLAKIDPRTGRVLAHPPTPFADKGITGDDVIKARSAIRDRLCAAGGRSCEKKHPFSTYAGFDDKNQVTLFLFDANYLNKLSDMEAQGLLQGQSPRAPWSDSYWPVQKGIIARRWLDPSFPDSRTFIDNYNYYMANPPSSMGVNILSPAEKYDLLVGDYSFRLTNANWAEGKYTWDKRGMVPGWAGICHGWSPAAILTPAPKRSVTLESPNGTMVTFYPSDIKALASAAFANAPPKNYFVGTRCDVSRPNEDDMGRVIDPGCFDVNPGTWHIGVVNEMGLNKRSFVLDSQYDYQIWNYPLYSYKYSYFNPQTLEASQTLGGASVKITDFSIDKFKKYRSPDAKYVVGVSMEISYSTETAPSTKPIQKPVLVTEKILYDLELDANGAIIGGEWYSNFHPDFMWHFAPDAQPISVGEQDLASPVPYDGSGPVPDELRKAALTSSVQEQPLAAVIETLVKLSQQTDDQPQPTSNHHP